MSDTQVLELEGVHNFRDYGGYALAGGGRLKRGILWRSGQHHGATDSDVKKIDQLGLTSVFDLRTSKERTAFPCRRPESFGTEIHHSDDPARNMAAPHVEAARFAGAGTSQAAYDVMRHIYTGIAFRTELKAMIGNLARDMIDNSDHISLVNCLAGKDRTGMAVAAIHLAVGVHRDDVMADYLLTNTAGDAEARVREGMRSLMTLREGVTEEAARTIMGVEAEYLQEALASIEAKSGGVDAYLEQEIGLDSKARERLRDSIAES